MNPKPVTPYACIRRTDSETYCGRGTYSGEFMFRDGASAVQNYEHG